MKSLITYFLLITSLIIFSFTYLPKYKLGGSEATISWDVSGYYWYLPATFIYHDLKGLRFSDSVRNAYGCSPDNQQITSLPDGQQVLKYSSGMALQYLPFFLTAHALAGPLGYKADGFSAPYQLALQLGALLVFLLGLWYLRNVLLHYFKDATVAWVLVLLVAGTNYLNYAAIDIGMTHCWLFSWYCFLLYGTHLFYSKATYKRAAFIGLCIGIMVLTRPTEIIAILIPALWGLNVLRWSAIRERFQFLKTHWLHAAIAATTLILIGSIQLVYWKYATGHWLVYSYGDQHFSWKHPHVLLYSISYRCGWLRYCPMLLLPYLGFLLLMKRRDLFWSLAAFSFCYFWIVTAWDIWWYGGRAMIQGYAVLMFPFAALIEFAMQRWFSRILFIGVAALFVYLNIWWTHGVHKGGFIYATDMSKAYYNKIVGHWTIDERDRKLLDVDEDYDRTPTGTTTLLQYHFDQGRIHEQLVDGQAALMLDGSQPFEVHYKALPSVAKNEWVRSSASIHCLKNNWDILRMTQYGLRFFKAGTCIKENHVLLDRLFYQQADNTIYVDAHIAGHDYDSLQVFFAVPKEAQGGFLIHSLNAESFR